MFKAITVNDYDLPIREYNRQRVVTFKDIDGVHGRADGTARRNFNTNREHFIEGTDYFKVCANEIRSHKILDVSSKAREDITLITESGYLMLVKSFTDELAWDVQRALVNNYFRFKNNESCYSTKSTSVGEIATMIKTLRSVMKDQQSNPIKIAVMAECVCRQFGISIPQDFVEAPEPERQFTLETYGQAD